MKLVCLNCGHEFNGTVDWDELGWHSACPVCKGSFDVDIFDEDSLVQQPNGSFDYVIPPRP